MKNSNIDIEKLKWYIDQNLKKLKLDNKIRIELETEKDTISIYGAVYRNVGEEVNGIYITKPKVVDIVCQTSIDLDEYESEEHKPSYLNRMAKEIIAGLVNAGHIRGDELNVYSSM